MTYPTDPLSPLGERLKERTQPLAPDDATYDWAHAKLCEGMMLPFEQLAELVDPEDETMVPWEPLFDVNICPEWALPWLGQLVGVRVPAGLTEQQKRDMIKGLANFKRGSPEAIIAAAQLTLTGNATVLLRERDAGNPYQLEVVTYSSETPDPAATMRAILSQIPAAIVLTSRAQPAWDYEQMTLRGGTYAEQTLAYSTYADLAIDNAM